MKNLGRKLILGTALVGSLLIGKVNAQEPMPTPEKFFQDGKYYTENYSADMNGNGIGNDEVTALRAGYDFSPDKIEYVDYYGDGDIDVIIFTSGRTPLEVVKKYDINGNLLSHKKEKRISFEDDKSIYLTYYDNDGDGEWDKITRNTLYHRFGR